MTRWTPAMDSRPRHSWPAAVTVPPPPTRDPRNAPEGHEEGDLCGRPNRRTSFCLGKLENRPSLTWGGCTCFRSAPCGKCMSTVPECPLCSHREPEPD